MSTLSTALACGLSVASSMLFLVGCTQPNASVNSDATIEQDGSVAIIDANPALDSGLDAAPICPTTTHQCVAEAPSDQWSGPVARTSSMAPNAPATCGDNYSVEAWHVFGDLVANGTCSCSCTGDASGTSCTDAVLRGYFAELGGEAPCSAPVSGATVSLPATSLGASCNTTPLASISSIRDVRVTLGQVANPGSCDEVPQVTNSIVSAEFALEDRYCGVATAIEATCDGVTTCVPQVDSGFASELCIYQVGEHTCDESAVYTERFVRFQDSSDERSCGACACDAPAAGSSCGGFVRMGQRLPIGGRFTCNGTFNTGSCGTDPWVTPDDGAQYVVLSSFSCSASGGGVIGAASGTNAVTFCCQAPTQ